jgi:hypothetical protein
MLSRRWPFAAPSQILAAKNKDDHLIGLIRDLLPHEANPMIAHAIYLVLTKLDGRTVGEEWANIRQVDIANSKFTSRLRNLLYCVLALLIAHKNQIARKLRWAELVSEATFYWQQKYLELSKRVLSMRFVAEHEIVNRNDPIYFLLSIVNALKGLVQLAKTSVEDDVSERGDKSTTMHLGVACAMCTEMIQCPGVLPCSHAFCVECAFKWIQERPWCPLCRRECKPPQIFYPTEEP